MNAFQHTKFLNITPPAAIVDNAAFGTTTVDTAGFAYLTIIVSLGAIDIVPTTLKVQESDDSGMSGAADITGTRIGTDADAFGTTSVLPIATTDADKIVVFELDLRGRKRYIDLAFTGGNGSAGTYASVLGILSRAEVSPNSETTRGTLWNMRV